MAELLRLKAEVLANMPQGDREAAANLLKQAIRSARAQSALAYELRSATSLALLLSESVQRDEARHVLRPIYDRLKEDIETPDLNAARELLATFG
jgi:predicted ATPase